MRRMRASVGTLCLWAGLFGAVAVPAQTAFNPQDFHTIGTVQNFADILDTVVVIGGAVTENPVPGAVLRSTGDVHVVADVSMERIVHHITNIGAYQEFVPRIDRSLASLVNVSPPTWHFSLVLGYDVILFRRTYEVASVFEDRTDQALAAGAPVGARAFSFRMRSSLDGQLAAADGGWYLQPVTIDGNTYTYVRYSILTDYRETTFGLRYALRMFSANELTATMEAFIHRARTIPIGGNE